MSQSVRKFLGMIMLVGFVSIYTLLAMLIGAVKFHDTSVLIKTIYFAFAGLLWIIPAGIIIKWMQRPDEKGKS